MAPKAVVYHILGQHLCGEALVGYAVGPDTPIMLPPKLNLQGGLVIRNAPSMAAPGLNLTGSATVGGFPPGPRVAAGNLFLRGGAAVGGLPPGPRIGSTPALNLRGGDAYKAGPPPGPRYTTAPVLNLLGVPTLFTLSQVFVMGIPELMLLGAKAVGKEKSMVGTRPVDWILEPTIDTEGDLEPTVEEDWLLVPTTERDM